MKPQVGQDRPRLAVVELRSFLASTPPGQALPCYRLEEKILVRRSVFDAYMDQYRTQGRPALA